MNAAKRHSQPLTTVETRGFGVIVANLRPECDRLPNI